MTFPLSTKIDVNGKNTHPVFVFLKDRTGGLLGSAIKWNFTKFLVARTARRSSGSAPTTDPADIAARHRGPAAPDRA